MNKEQMLEEISMLRGSHHKEFERWYAVAASVDKKYCCEVGWLLWNFEVKKVESEQ